MAAVPRTRPRTNLTDLASHQSGPVVSILIPPRPTEVARRTIKTLAGAARDRLIGWGVRSVDAKATAGRIIEHADRLLDRPGPTTDMALYVGGTIRVERGPRAGDPAVQVAPRFHITHLLADPDPASVTVLTLSRSQAVLYRVDGVAVTAVSTDRLPLRWEDVNQFVDREPQLQSHARSHGGADHAFHGHETGIDPDDITRYLEAASDAVRAAIGGAPLVVIATEELGNRFRKLSHIEGIQASTVPATPDHATIEQIQAAAHGAIEHLREEHRAQALAALDDASPARAIVGDDRAILPLAIAGRIEMLVVHRPFTAWVAYDPETAEAEPRTATDPDAEDVANLAALETSLHRGLVVQAPDRDETTGAMSALLRY